MFHLGSYWWLVGITNIYQNLGDLTRSGDFTWRVSDCEELVGVNQRWWWGLFFLLSIFMYNLVTEEETKGMKWLEEKVAN